MQLRQYSIGPSLLRQKLECLPLQVGRLRYLAHMTDHRTSVGRGIGLIWSPDILLPQRPPTVIYLDLNHWINLTKASLARGSEPYIELLAALRAARECRSIRVVLSVSFVEEFWAIRNPRQRDDIVGLIDELTDFEYLLGLPDVFRLELQAYLDQTVGGRGLKWGAVNLIGKSMLLGFGKKGGLRIIDEATGDDITDRARQEPQDGDPDWFANLERRAEKDLLAGPRDAELEGLRANGYQPERSRESHHNNVLIEQYFADEMLDHHWRKGRLLELLSARHLSLELIDMFNAELIARGVTLADVATQSRQLLELPLSMPASAVFVGLKVQYHRDASRRWTDNDLHDIGAMALAIPYCDIVFTDAAVRNAAVTAGLDRAMSTRMPRSPAELTEMVEGFCACS